VLNRPFPVIPLLFVFTPLPVIPAPLAIPAQAGIQYILALSPRFCKPAPANIFAAVANQHELLFVREALSSSGGGSIFLYPHDEERIQKVRITNKKKLLPTSLLVS
jgi:hypothetical protein